MEPKTPAQKMRIKPGSTIAVLNDTSGVAGLLGAEDMRMVDTVAGSDAVLLAVTTQAEVEERLPLALRDITRDTAFWIVYPKGATAAGRDVSRDTIWKLAESLGLRPVGLVSIDDTWSGFRLRPAG